MFNSISIINLVTYCKTKICFVFFTQESVYVTGTSETECEVTTEMDLKCKFGENINSTYKDFLVFSSSDNGLEGTKLWLVKLIF